jgi:type I restriction enzyme S subunit
VRLFRVAWGDFIYSRLFASRGAFGVVPRELDGCYVSAEFPTFVAASGQLSADFLKYWFRLPDTMARVNEYCSGSTPLTRNRFKEQFFLGLTIRLPPLVEQRRVVTWVDELAINVGRVHALRKEQDRLSREMLLRAFWAVAQHAPPRAMRDVAPLVRRPVIPEAATIYPELGIRSFGKGTFPKPALSGLEIGMKRIFRIEPRDLLFSNVFAWEGAVAVATPADGGRFGSHRFITRVVNEGEVTPEFLRFYFLTSEGLEKLGIASPGGAGRNRTLGLEALDQIKVPVPSLKLQEWFDGLQAKVDAVKRLQAESAAALDALLPSILDRAFKGGL